LNKTFSIIMATLLLLVITNSYAGEKVARSLIVPKSGAVLIQVSRGFVKVEGWDKGEISLQGELDDSVKELIFKNKGKKTLIKVTAKGLNHWGDGSVLKIYVPRDLEVYFKSVNATFSFVNLASGVEGKTMSGDLMANNVHTALSLSSVSGRVKVINSSGLAEIESVNGEIDFSGEFEEVELKSMSGDITVNIDKIQELDLENISGDSLILGNIRNKADIRLESVSGDIYYKSSGELNAKCELETQFGGEIENKLTKDKPVSSSMHQKKLQFVSGDGSGELRMNSVTGSVTIDKKP